MEAVAAASLGYNAGLAGYHDAGPGAGCCHDVGLRGCYDYGLAGSPAAENCLNDDDPRGSLGYHGADPVGWHVGCPVGWPDDHPCNSCRHVGWCAGCPVGWHAGPPCSSHAGCGGVDHDARLCG